MSADTTHRPRRLLFVILLPLLLLAACGGGDSSTGRAEDDGRLRTPDGEAETEQASRPVSLTDLSGVEELKAVFNKDQDLPRLILVLSPT